MVVADAFVGGMRKAANTIQIDAVMASAEVREACRGTGDRYSDIGGSSHFPV
jgi:hypothetical protein